MSEHCLKSHCVFLQVRQAFLSRRKMLRNSLQIDQSSEQIGAALAAAGLSPDARAQDLTTQDFARFARCLDKMPLRRLEHSFIMLSDKNRVTEDA